MKVAGDHAHSGQGKPQATGSYWQPWHAEMLSVPCLSQMKKLFSQLISEILQEAESLLDCVDLNDSVN